MDVLEYVEGQNNEEKMWKTLRNCPDSLLKLSSKEKRKLGKDFSSRFAGKSI